MPTQRDGPNPRNSERALVWPYVALSSTDAIEPIGTLRVYRERGKHYAQNPHDNDILGSVVPATGERTGYVCASTEAEMRIKQRSRES